MDDPSQLIKLFIALAFVLALMGGFALLMKKLGLSDAIPTKTGDKRLKIVESLALDTRRRLVIVSCDGQEHLVILGPNGETLIQSNIESPDDKKNSV